VLCVLVLTAQSASGAPMTADSGSGPTAPRGMSFHSLPGLHPPRVTVSGTLDQGSGDIFLTPRNSYQRRITIQHGPMILNSQGQLVWFHKIRRGLAANLEVQRYMGQPVLTWWEGTADNGVSRDVIMDSTYHVLARLHAGDGATTDTHEFQITPRGTALVAAVRHLKVNLKSLGGPRHGIVTDDVIQELDVKTGRVLWQWHSYGHVGLRASYARPWGSNPFDYFHLNSVQRLPNGNLLVCARATWAIYEISRRTGRVVWSLGGKHSSFKLGPRVRFSWQHDARLIGDRLSLFDDATDGPSEQETESSAKVLELDMTRMRARLVRSYRHSPAVLTVSQGNAQTLPNRDLFVGWGADPEFSEYSPSGHQLFDGSFELGVNSYRAYRFPWTGHPSGRPALAITDSSGGAVTLYASWNGATQVSAWRVRGGRSGAALEPVTQARRTGFETVMHVTSSLPYFEVQALDANGKVLGSSVVRSR
jgi:hypothetical protein